MDIILNLIITIVLILIILTFHELAHGWTAWQFGDPTAKYEGRLTLNPISHLDPIGALCLTVTVCLGPVSNFIMAFIGAILFQLLGRMPLMNIICIRFIQINLALGLFNLIPIPPLDGFRILMGLLPQNMANNIEYKVSSNPAFQYVGIIIAILIANAIIMAPYRYLFGLLS